VNAIMNFRTPEYSGKLSSTHTTGGPSNIVRLHRII
jgi:hypothetical protein